MNRAWSMTLIVATALAHAAAPDDYAIVVPLTTAGDSPAWRVELPIEAYAWSQDEALRDVAVFDADGRSLSLAEWTAPQATPSGARIERLPLLALPASARLKPDWRRRSSDKGVWRTPSSDTVSPGGSEDAGVRATAPANEDKLPDPQRAWLIDVNDFAVGIDRLRLTWTQPADGVFAHFAVDKSQDLEAWRPVQDDAVIARLLGTDARIERNTIALDGMRTRYLRLRRLDDGPDLVDLVVEVEHFARTIQQAARLLWTPAEPIAAPASMNAFDYQLPARLPIESLRVTLAGDNSASEFVLSSESTARDGRSAREPLLRFTAYRLRAGGDVLDQGEIAVARTHRIDRLRLDASHALATTPALQVGWRPATFVFLAEGRAPYVLAAGRAGAQRESTSLATPLAELRARFGDDWQPPVATTGVVRIAAGEAALRPPPAPGSWRRILLWVVLGGGAVLVAGLAMALLRGQRDVG